MLKNFKVRMFYPKSTMHYRQDIVLECMVQQINFDNNSEIGIQFDHIGDYKASFMKYIGHKDKYGNDVYVGDVVRDNCNHCYVVEQSEDSFDLQRIKQWADGTYAKQTLYNNLMYSKDSFEVIGNIYENKEFRGIN